MRILAFRSPSSQVYVVNNDFSGRSHCNIRLSSNYIAMFLSVIKMYNVYMHFGVTYLPVRRTRRDVLPIATDIYGFSLLSFFFTGFPISDNI